VSAGVLLVFAVVGLVVWILVAAVAAGDWRRFHDERAARGVLLSLILVAAGIGGVISAAGYYAMVDLGQTGGALPIASALVRGATIVGGIAYLASLRRKGKA
jgi:hypothetical protein